MGVMSNLDIERQNFEDGRIDVKDLSKTMKSYCIHSGIVLINKKTKEVFPKK